MQQIKTTLLISLSLLLMSAFSSAIASDSKVTFHFYGANDCPPCMAFKRNNLANVEISARKHGFSVAVNIIDKTSDVPEHGSFGSTDEMLRKAAPSLQVVYPPIFFVTVDGVVVMASSGNWRKAQTRAEREASASS